MKILALVFNTSRVEGLEGAGTEVGIEARGFGGTKTEVGLGFVFFGIIGGLALILAFFAKGGAEFIPTSEIGRFFDVVCSENIS